MPHVGALPASISIGEPVVVIVVRSDMGDTTLVMVSISTIIASISANAVIVEMGYRLRQLDVTYLFG